MHNPEAVLENGTLKILSHFEIQTDHLISAIRADRMIVKKKHKHAPHPQKKRTCRIVNHAVLADHKVKLKENEKRDKYLDLARELKKLWNMKVMVIPVVFGALGTVTKKLVQWLEDLEISWRVKTIQTAALLRSAWLLRRVLEDLRRLTVTQTPVINH